MDNNKVIDNLIFPIPIALTVLFFVHPLNYYIFGQDSLPIFGQFTFYQNPLYGANNGLEMFYFSFFTEAIDRFLSDPSLAERVLIILGTYISSVGFFDLIDVLCFLPRRNIRITSKYIGTIFFLYNPFTLSVTWAHLAGWSFLILLSPFIISFLTYTVFNGLSIRRFTVTSIVSMILAGGFTGEYYPFFLIVVGIFILFPIYRIIYCRRDKTTVKANLRKISFILIFVVVSTLWANISYAYTGFASITSSSSLMGKSLVQFFLRESETTSLSHVLRLVGYSFIYKVSDAYPWIGSLPVLSTASLLMILLFSIASLIIRDYRKILPIFIVSAVAVMFSVGANFPFGFINEHLLLLRGPFLFLVNPYYFALQFYVLFLGVIFALVFYFLVERLKKYAKRDVKTLLGRAKQTVTANYKEFIAIILIVFVVSTFAYPFVTNQVYQNNGNNIDEININNGLQYLDTFLHVNYSAPDYLSLLIPTSSLDGGTYLEYKNNSTFSDDRGLISTVDPYPLIWQNNSYLASSVENYLSSGDFNNMLGVFQFLHIKYVIFTWKYDSSSYWMQHSPDRKEYNMTNILEALNTSLGHPVKIGVYYVFTVPNVRPIVGAISNPASGNLPLQKYLYFLGSINLSTVSPMEQSLFENYTFPFSFNTSNKVSFFNYTPQKSELFPNNVTLAMLNGTLLSPQAIGFLPRDNTVRIGPMPVADNATYHTDMAYSNGSLYSSSSSYLNVNNVSQQSYVNLTFNIHGLLSGERNCIQFVFGNDIIDLEFINVSNGNGNMDLQLTANFLGQGYYAWNNVGIPYSFIGNNTDMSIVVNPNTSIKETVEIPESGFFQSSIFYYGPNNFKLNPGFDSSNYVRYVNFSGKYNFSMQSGAFPVSIYNFSIFKTYPIQYIIVESLPHNPQYLKSSISTGLYGNYILNLRNASENSYVYFFMPSTDGWEVSVAGDNAYTVANSTSFMVLHFDKLSSSPLNIDVHYKSIIQIIFPISLVEFILLFVILAIALVRNYSKVHKKLEKII